MADWLHVRPTLRRSCLSSQGQGRPETFRLALELRLLDSKICHLARPPITFEPLFGPAQDGPCLQLAQSLRTPCRHLDS